MLSYTTTKLFLVILLQLHCGYGYRQENTDVVASYATDEIDVKKEYPCPTKCSPVHYCSTTLYTNETATSDM